MRRLRTIPMLTAIVRLLQTPWQRLAGPPRQAPQHRVLMEFRGTPILVKEVGREAIVTFRVDDWLTPPAARFVIMQTRRGCVQPGRRCLVRISAPAEYQHSQPVRPALVATLAEGSAGTTIEMIGLAA